MEPRFKVRCMKPEEIGRVCELVNSLQVHQKMKHCPRLPSVDELRNELVYRTEDGKLMASNNGTFTVVAVDMSRYNEPNYAYIVGYLIYSQSFSIIWGRSFFMNSFFIDEKYRGSGLGKKLMEYVRLHFVANRNNRVDVPFMNDNKLGQKFYSKYGATLVNDEFQLMKIMLDNVKLAIEL